MDPTSRFSSPSGFLNQSVLQMRCMRHPKASSTSWRKRSRSRAERAVVSSTVALDAKQVTPRALGVDDRQVDEEAGAPYLGLDLVAQPFSIVGRWALKTCWSRLVKRVRVLNSPPVASRQIVSESQYGKLEMLSSAKTHDATHSM